MNYEKDQVITTPVLIKKVKKGLPTVIIVEGHRYVLKHENQYNSGGLKK